MIIFLTQRSFPLFKIEITLLTYIAATTFVISIVVILMGVIAFRRAKTTVDPTQPQKSSSLVISNIYKVTRNPMYLGFLGLLTAEVIFFQHYLSLPYLALFVAYMNRFQIKPEEQMLAELFGDEYHSYCQSVRRWL
ncbi:methyltransferase family protein [Colwellia sp. MEBiC06753]